MNGEQNPNWKGGRYVSNGYVYVHRPTHLRANKDGYVLEHRLVIEEARGISLNPSMLVHHKNEIKNDNRLENLQVMTRLEHLAHHGRLRPFTDEMKKKVSEANKGKVWTEERKKRDSAQRRMLGFGRWNKGKKQKLSPEERSRRSERMTQYNQRNKGL